MNAEDHNRNTPLHMACRIGDISTVSLLLKKGALVNAQNKVRY